MESNLNKSPIAPQTGDETLISAGQSSEQRISELSTALVVVTENFRSYRIKLRRQILIWIIVCIIIIIISGFFASLLLNESFPDKWTWQIGYISIIRITIAGAIFSIANFCFRIYRSYVQLNEHNTHCITVINALLI